MVNMDPLLFDDAHKENAIYANQSSNHVKSTSKQDIERQKPTKSQIQARKRRILCELTEAEIQARSIPRNEEVIESNPTQTNSTSQPTPESSSLPKESHSLFKAARLARRKQSITKKTASQISPNTKETSTDKVTSIQKPQRNLR